ncbi:unnamed protein product, partial [Prorocentrum cordatum]
PAGCATPPPRLPLRPPRGVAGLAAVEPVDFADLWSPREGAAASPTTGGATCGGSERDFLVVSRPLARLVDEELLLGDSPACGGGCDAAHGVDPELLEFLEGDPWEECGDVAEWGLVEWCADIARLRSSKVDEDAAALLAMFLAGGDADGDSTRPNALSEQDMSRCPSMESTGKAPWFLPCEKPGRRPCSSRSLEGAAGLFFADGDTDGGSTRPNTLADMSDRPSMEPPGTASLLFPSDRWYPKEMWTRGAPDRFLIRFAAKTAPVARHLARCTVPNAPAPSGSGSSSKRCRKTSRPGPSLTGLL